MGWDGEDNNRRKEYDRSFLHRDIGGKFGLCMTETKTEGRGSGTRVYFSCRGREE